MEGDLLLVGGEALVDRLEEGRGGANMDTNSIKITISVSDGRFYQAI